MKVFEKYLIEESSNPGTMTEIEIIGLYDNCIQFKNNAGSETILTQAVFEQKINVIKQIKNTQVLHN